MFLQTLATASKVSKKEAKNLAAKAQHVTSGKAASSISSPNVATPSSHSSFYYAYKDKLESNREILKEPLRAGNYKEKFHHLLCWEEQEHDKQLTERCAT